MNNNEVKEKVYNIFKNVIENNNSFFSDRWTDKINDGKLKVDITDSLLQVDNCIIEPIKRKYIEIDVTDYHICESIEIDRFEEYLTGICKLELKKLENVRWSGNTDSDDPMINTQDGVVKQLLAAAGTVRPTFVAGALLNPTTVIDELNKLILNAPSKVRFNPNFAIIVSPEVLAAYQAAVSSNQAYATYNVAGMYTIANQQTNAPAYVGQFVGYNVKMYVATGLSGFNDQVAIAAVTSKDFNGNFVSKIQITEITANKTNDNKIDICILFKHAVGIRKCNNVVLYSDI